MIKEVFLKPEKTEIIETKDSNLGNLESIKKDILQTCKSIEVFLINENEGIPNDKSIKLLFRDFLEGLKKLKEVSGTANHFINDESKESLDVFSYVVSSTVSSKAFSDIYEEAVKDSVDFEDEVNFIFNILEQKIAYYVPVKNLIKAYLPIIT